MRLGPAALVLLGGAAALPLTADAGQRSACFPPAVFQVFKADASGAKVLLDEGSDIDPASLALSRATVYWTRAGRPTSAPLY